MNRSSKGLRLAVGLCLSGGLMLSGMATAQASSVQPLGNSLALTPAFVYCKGDGYDPYDCTPIEPETPSKRGGIAKEDPKKPDKPDNPDKPNKPNNHKPNHGPKGGGFIEEPPTPNRPNNGGYIPTAPTNEPVRAISSGGNSTPFTATHQAIPNVDSDGFAWETTTTTTTVAASAPAVSQPVQGVVESKPVVANVPHAGVGPASMATTLPAGLAALATLFGAVALYVWRRPALVKLDR